MPHIAINAASWLVGCTLARHWSQQDRSACHFSMGIRLHKSHVVLCWELGLPKMGVPYPPLIMLTLAEA